MGNFIIFVLALFGLAALLRIDFFFTILYLFVAVYILARVWSRQSLHRLRIKRSLPQRAFSGDQIKVSLEFSNASPLPILWLMFTESLPIELGLPLFREVITLAGKGSYQTHYSLAARKRGYYKIGPLLLQTGDVLGIRAELSGRFEANYLIVYPKVVPLSQLGLPAHSPQVVLPTPIPLFQDPHRMIGVRAYSPGDNPRHIHWPATATAGKLLVKQFQPAIARDNAIFLNLSRADYAKQSYPEAAVELAIIVAASLAHHIIRVEQLPVGLMTVGLDPLSATERCFNLPANKGQGQLMQILEVLARVQAVEESHFLPRIRQAALHLSWGTTLIIITSHLEKNLQEMLLLLKRSGFQITLVLVSPLRYRPAQRVEAVPEMALPTFKIQREKDIELWTPVI